MNNVKDALQYLINAGGMVKLKDFLEDAEHIGVLLYTQLREQDFVGKYSENNGYVVITEKGRAKAQEEKQDE